MHHYIEKYKLLNKYAEKHLKSNWKCAYNMN